MDFKVDGWMPIVVSLDIAFNPLANIKCLVPNTRQLLYPGILKYEVRLLTLPHPKPFPGFFFDLLKRPERLNFGVANSTQNSHLLM
jgi:hypothetical protein